MSIIQTTVAGVLISVGLLFAPSIQQFEAPSPVIANIEETQAKQTQRPDALDKWIDKLAFCESSNNPEAINRFDGGSPSYGYLQIKSDTFWGYNQKYKVLPDLERQEVMNIIMCKDTQIALAREIIINEANGRGWRNWYHCSKIIGLDKLDVSGL